MKARMLSVLGWIRDRFVGEDTPPTRPRRPPGRRLASLESLERREVLSTSAATFTPFATLAGSVTTAGKPAQVDLHFAAGQVTSSSSSSVMVGFYVEAANGSTAVPQITEVDGSAGVLTRVALPKRGGMDPSKSLYVTYLNTSLTSAQDVIVDVTDPGKGTGDFTLKAFLPGDVNGNGTVEVTDLSSLETAYGTSLGQANNIPTADFNADGHVGCIDRRLTQLNIGAHIAYTPVTPVAAANITPAVVATPAKVATPVVTPTPAPVVTTPAPAVTTPAPAVKTTPVVVATTTPVVVATPVVATTTPVVTTTTPVVTATPVVTTTPAVTTTSAVAAVPVLTYAYPQTTGAVSTSAPVYYYGQSVVQGPTAATTTTTTSGTTSAPVYYYGQPVVQGPATTTTSGTTSAPVYYYGQSVVQSPTTAATTTSGTTSAPLYYYGQPTTVPSPTTYVQASAAGPVYYLSQPIGQASSALIPSTTIPVSYATTPVMAPTSTSAAVKTS